MMRIAVIGGGVSGLSAAWALRNVHDVTLFERDERLGGHANTVEIDYDGAVMAVDTGFVVFNEKNYPHFTALLDHLGVQSIESDMSFSVSDPSGFEWSSNGIAGLFAWKRNLTRPAFLAMLTDILKFNRAAVQDMRGNRINGATLEEYVESLRLSPHFLSNYLLPMGAAIWSTTERDMLRYPASAFLRFFDNHSLLSSTNRIEWRTVAGGSQSYVHALRTALGSRIRAGSAAKEIVRHANGVSVRTVHGDFDFDQIILACHPDQSLAILADATNAERSALDAIKYAPNEAFLHRDTRLMPHRAKAWASWNYLRGRNEHAGVCVSYWMNRLQRLDPQRPVFVTLNPDEPPAPAQTFARFTYDHPQFNSAALAAQDSIGRLQGTQRTWFAGAWLGYGFHEDGLASGLAVAQRLGARIPWNSSASRPMAERPRMHTAPLAAGASG